MFLHPLLKKNSVLYFNPMIIYQLILNFNAKEVVIINKIIINFITAFNQIFFNFFMDYLLIKIENSKFSLTFQRENFTQIIIVKPFLLLFIALLIIFF